MTRAAPVLLLAAAAILSACTSSPAAPHGERRGAEANAAWRRGDLTRGRRQYVEALHEDVLASDEAGAVRHLNNVGVLDVHAGRDRDAEASFAQALARSSGPTADVDRRRLSLQRAALSLRRGREEDLRTAGAILRDAGLAQWTETAEPADRVQYWSLVSALLLRSRAGGDDAVAEARRAAERAREAADSDETRAAAGLAVGRALLAAGSRDEARVAYEGALAAALESSHPWLQLAALRALARVSPPGEDKTRYTRLADELAEELRARVDGGAD